MIPRFFGVRRTRRIVVPQARSGRRIGIEALEGRIALSISGTPALPLFTFGEATTKDAASVTVDYSISKADIQQPLRFDVYRSDQTGLDSSSTLVGETTLDPTVDASELTQGNHTGVTLLQGTVLTPNTALPYVVVVADGNGAVSEDPGSVNTTYFRTFMLGVVVHGLEFSASGATPAWETTMANDLVSTDHYDKSIAFNWVRDSSLPIPGMTTKAGDALYSQIVASASALEANHAGDVVDLQLIGHSRGAVVVSRALEDVVNQPTAALWGSYVDVTLLDPHPSNGANDGLASFRKGPLGAVAAVGFVAFQAATKDPGVVLPAGAGIRAIDVFYQHTPAADFPNNNLESLINLWGEGPNDNLLVNQSGVSIQWHNLTAVNDPALGFIGHTEIHDWYQLHVVDTGGPFATAQVASSSAHPSSVFSSASVSMVSHNGTGQVVSTATLLMSRKWLGRL